MKINIIKNNNPIKKRREELHLKLPSDKDKQDFNKIENLDIIKATKDKYHIVSIGIIGLTFFSTVCDRGFGIGQPEQESLIQPVLDNKETGTVYPKSNLTILPHRYKTNAGYTLDGTDVTGGEGFATEEIKKHILDALQAETDHVKSGKVIFDFRDLGDEMDTYNSILHYIIINNFRHIEGDIFYYSFNNKEFVTESEYRKYEILYTSSDKKYYEQRIKERQTIIQQEKIEKQHRKELKKQQNEPKLSAQKIKATDARTHIVNVRHMDTESKLTLISESDRAIYFYSDILNEILNTENLKNFEGIIKKIIAKFKINENGKFKLIKSRLEKAIQPITGA